MGWGREIGKKSAAPGSPGSRGVRPGPICCCPGGSGGWGPLFREDGLEIAFLSNLGDVAFGVSLGENFLVGKDVHP